MLKHIMRGATARPRRRMPAARTPFRSMMLRVTKTPPTTKRRPSTCAAPLASAGGALTTAAANRCDSTLGCQEYRPEAFSGRAGHAGAMYAPDDESEAFCVKQSSLYSRHTHTCSRRLFCVRLRCSKHRQKWGTVADCEKHPPKVGDTAA